MFLFGNKKRRATIRDLHLTSAIGKWPLQYASDKIVHAMREPLVFLLSL